MNMLSLFSKFNTSLINNRTLKFNDSKIVNLNPIITILMLILATLLLVFDLKNNTSLSQKKSNYGDLQTAS